MKIQQRGYGSYARTKYSQIPSHETAPCSRADWAVQFILKNGYAVVQGYHLNEVLKVVRSLRELGLEYTMKTIEGQESVAGDKKWRDMYYEFTTVLFEDDRQLPVELKHTSIRALLNELEERVQKGKAPNVKCVHVLPKGRGTVTIDNVYQGDNVSLEGEHTILIAKK